MSKKIVQINNLMKQYGQRRVVKDVSMTLNKGEIIGLLGPNGAGKTTTFYMITGMVRVSAGNIMLNDIDLTDMSMDKRARLGLGYLAQEPSIFTDLSVEDNLKLVLEFSNLDKPNQSEKLEELLNDFSIDHIRKSIAKHLSGGERRRTEIARALILNPDFNHELIDDSKKLSMTEREKLSKIIIHNSISYSVQNVYPNKIDEVNILNASILAMHKCIKNLTIKPEFLIIDGNKFKKYSNIPHKTIVKGDAKYLSIASASILAKHSRDVYMKKISKKFPNYFWFKNKGYPTQEHKEALKKYGITKHHRKSFKLFDEQLTIDF